LLVVEGEIHRASVLGGSGELAEAVVSEDSTVPALAAGNPDAARRLEALGFSGPIRVARSIAIAQFLRDIDRVAESGSAWELDSFGQQARYLPGGVIRGLQGEGLLVVSGDLRLEGRVDFAGVMLVEGTLELASDHCRIRGFVQIHAMKVHADCTFRRDLPAVLQADRLQSLPRQARLQAILPAHGS